MEAGVSGRVAQLLLEGSVCGKLVALEILRSLVLDQDFSEVVLDEAGLGPVAVALGVPPSHVMVEGELNRIWEGGLVSPISASRSSPMTPGGGSK